MKIRLLIIPYGTLSILQNYQLNASIHFHIWQVSRVKYERDIQKVTSVLTMLKNRENNGTDDIGPSTYSLVTLYTYNATNHNEAVCLFCEPRSRLFQCRSSLSWQINELVQWSVSVTNTLRWYYGRLVLSIAPMKWNWSNKSTSYVLWKQMQLWWPVTMAHARSRHGQRHIIVVYQTTIIVVLLSVECSF